MRNWLNTEEGKRYKEERNHAEYTKNWRKENKDKNKASQRRAYEAIRLECFQHYSGLEIPECRCCGENMIDFLHLDHKDGDGANHRRLLKEQTGRTILGGTSLYYYLKANDWPNDPPFQVLCANCNLGKRISKYCPHELERGLDMDGVLIPMEYYDTTEPMPINKGPERDAWLESPEGLQYREKQAAAKRGKPSLKDTRVEVPCTQCGAILKRKQCELTRRTNAAGEARFFCNMKCSGKWKSTHLIGDKIYNATPDLEFVCGYSGCGKILIRKQHQLRPGQTVVYCDKTCADKAKVGKPAWNKGLHTSGGVS
jgi:hypothetical protein